MDYGLAEILGKKLVHTLFVIHIKISYFSDDVTKHFLYFKGILSIFRKPCVSDGARRKLILRHSDFVKNRYTRIT